MLDILHRSKIFLDFMLGSENLFNRKSLERIESIKKRQNYNCVLNHRTALNFPKMVFYTILKTGNVNVHWCATRCSQQFFFATHFFSMRIRKFFIVRVLMLEISFHSFIASLFLRENLSIHVIMRSRFMLRFAQVCFFKLSTHFSSKFDAHWAWPPSSSDCIIPKASSAKWRVHSTVVIIIVRFSTKQ